MFKLLRADFYRAFRFKIFYLLISGNALVGLISVLNMYSYRMAFGVQYNAVRVLEQGMGGGFSFLGILSAIIVAIFIGHEYSSGAMRNKIMVGCGRSKIYLSKFIVSAVMCVAVYFSYHAVNFILGSVLLGWGDAVFSDVLMLFLAGLFLTLAYCGIFTFISMLSKSTVLSLIFGILGSLAVLMAVMILLGGLQGEYIADPNDPNGAILVPCRWPAWLQWLARAFINVMPSGQSAIISMGEGSCYGLYIALSAVWVVLSGAGGALLFRKVDLK